MGKKNRTLPLFEDVEGMEPQIRGCLEKVKERPAIALVRIEGSCERGGYGIYVLNRDKDGRELCGGLRIDDPANLEPCELAREQLAILGAIDDIKQVIVRAGLRNPRVFKFRLQAKAS